MTSPLRTVLDCARTMPFNEGLAIADSALRRGLISRRQLEDAADLLAGPGARAARRVARSADGRAANPFESALRAIVIDAGLSLEPQLLIVGEAESWRVDLGDQKLMLVAEADSFEYHGDRAGLERDCRRYDELVSRGWLVLRFSWEQVMFEQAWVTRILLTTYEQRGVHRRGGPTALSRSARARSRH